MVEEHAAAFWQESNFQNRIFKKKIILNIITSQNYKAGSLIFNCSYFVAYGDHISQLVTDSIKDTGRNIK